MFNLIKNLIATNLGKVLITLPLIMLGNNLLGAALAGLKKRFDLDRLKAGLFKGALVYAGVFVFALVSYFNNDLIVNFDGNAYTLVDAMYVIIWAAIIAYGKDGIDKLAKLFNFKVGDLGTINESGETINEQI